MKRALLILLLTSCLIGSAYAQERPPAGPFPHLPMGMRIYKDLTYVANGHEGQKLDLYVSENSGEQLPLIVWIHGGGWNMAASPIAPLYRGRERAMPLPASTIA